MSVRRPDVLLELALHAVRRAWEFLAGSSVDDYLGDAMRQSAVERQLEIAGEALGRLRKLDPLLFARIPEGEVVVGFRNVLAHGYASLDHRRVHAIASTRLEALEQMLVQLLSEFPEDP